MPPGSHCAVAKPAHTGANWASGVLDEHEAVQALINDPQNFPVLLYPGRDSRDLSKGELPVADLAGRRLVVFLLDATWRLVRPMFRTSLSLQRLPRIMFTNAAPSRYIIKRQPEPGCLSTLEATHELLGALDRAGLDVYSQPTQLIDLFHRMQDFQIRRAAENALRGDRRPPRPNPEASSSVGAPFSSKRRRVFPAPPPG